MSMRLLKRILLGLAVVAAGIQFVQPDRANPPSDPAGSFEALVRPSPRAADILRRACQNCHSNQTVWPWYSRVAPMSWLVADDVKDGRAKLNFSEWNRLSPELARRRMGAICKEVSGGDMPLWQYRLLHAESKLTASDISALCALAPAPISPVSTR
jgi:hypothetical protein